MTIGPDDIDKILSYHKLGSEQQRRIANLRLAAKELANTIMDECPATEDRDVAIRRLREALMFANYSIASDEKREG